MNIAVAHSQANGHVEKGKQDFDGRNKGKAWKRHGLMGEKGLLHSGCHIQNKDGAILQQEGTGDKFQAGRVCVLKERGK
ncbi:hypothetical protein Tco_0860241 [Tanacetum coccineum]|uniref:Uncharacterized protein n=1 Tax=Tanacetum coccineum TaxID=301880 RepID=A0ABQ5BIC6_9ASTR